MRLNWLSAIEMEEVCLAGCLNTHRTMVASRKKPRNKWLRHDTEWTNMKVLFFFFFSKWSKETNGGINYCSTAFQEYQQNLQSILEPCQKLFNVVWHFAFYKHFYKSNAADENENENNYDYFFVVVDVNMLHVKEIVFHILKWNYVGSLWSINICVYFLNDPNLEK